VTWQEVKQHLQMGFAKLKGQERIHFLHVGKTGGTAVKEALQGHLKINNRRIFLHSHDYSLMDVPEGDKVFFFLRDPISRFVSGFYSRKRKGRPRYYYPWSEEEEKAFNRFETPNELATALSDEQLEKQEAARYAMKSISHVQDFYLKWYGNESYFLSRLSDILLVGRQETLEQDFSRLKQLLDLPSHVRLPSKDQKAHKNPSHLDTDLEKEAIQNLSDWYASDYAFLELCERYADQIRYSGLKH
jgi:hypothetical protein